MKLILPAALFGAALAALPLLAAYRGIHPPAQPAPATPADKVELGRALFFDAGLSASGRESCASCHSPAQAYGPPNARAVQLGGPHLTSAGLRAVPSLRYTLARTPVWTHPRPVSVAEQVLEKDNVPRGGFDWDGRFNFLHDQAAFPLTASSEMASTPAKILAHLRTAPYAPLFRHVFGDGALTDPDRAFIDLRQALEAFELNDASFHPYSSRFDAWLDGKSSLTPQELRGLALFNDPQRGNCASCHISQRGADGSHPLFTDFQFEALGVPRNPQIPANRDPHFFDLGLCGPRRTDQMANPSYCGLFKTPSLRNVATRRVFFHNGRFHTLREALEFYVQRDIRPERWYPGHARLPYNDLPPAQRVNVDRSTLPLTGAPGDKPVWNSADIDDVIAFLDTLTDADAHPPR